MIFILFSYFPTISWLCPLSTNVRGNYCTKWFLFFFPIFPQSPGSTFFKLVEKATTILFYFPIFPQSPGSAPFRKIVTRPHNSTWAKSLSNNGRTEGYIYTVLYVLYYKYILVAGTGCFVNHTAQYTVLYACCISSCFCTDVLYKK